MYIQVHCISCDRLGLDREPIFSAAGIIRIHKEELQLIMSYKGSKSSNYSGIDKSKQRITHNGIYLGNGKILHTYSVKSGGVRIDSIEGKHWEYRFVFGGSAFK